MRAIFAASLVALLAVPAHGQSQNKAPPGPPPPPPKSLQEMKAEKATQDAYENSLRKIPDQAPADPWGNARSLNAPKAVAKPAAKRAKAANTGPN
jgi:hypothetical protein